MKIGISLVKVAAALASVGIALTIAAGEAAAKKRYCRQEYCAKRVYGCGELRCLRCVLKGVRIVECGKG